MPEVVVAVVGLAGLVVATVFGVVVVNDGITAALHLSVLQWQY